MKRRFKYTIVFITIVLAAMALFKPGEESFGAWINARYKQKRAHMDEGGVAENLANKGVNKLTELQVLATYHYQNHYFFSTVDAMANGEEQKYIGIIGEWVHVPSFE